MKVSLIISTYNWESALKLCLVSVQNQSEKPLQVIIADDGSEKNTKNIIDSFRNKIPNLIHVWHVDEGFRLAEIRNKAISIATGDYIVQIDGDVILHRDFIKDHSLFAKQNTFIKGRRVMIGKKTSEKLLKSGNIKVSLLNFDLKRHEHGIRISNFQNIFNFKEEESADGVMGSNMAFWREDFIAVNGYNTTLQGWGAEDKELAQRFVNKGLKKRKIKFGGVQYHLYHKESDKSNHEKQLAFIQDLKLTKKSWCESGLKEIRQDFEVYE